MVQYGDDKEERQNTPENGKKYRRFFYVYNRYGFNSCTASAGSCIEHYYPDAVQTFRRAGRNHVTYFVSKKGSLYSADSKKRLSKPQATLFHTSPLTKIGGALFLIIAFIINLVG